MGTGFTVDLHDEDEDSIERGEFAPAGWYHCRMKDVSEDERNSSRTIFRYEILSGLFKGKIIKDQIDDPDSLDPDKQTIVRRRQKLIAKRLGLIGKEDYGVAEVAKDWSEAIGSEYIVHVEEREYTKKDQTKGVARSPAFDGIFPLDYPKDRFPKEFRESQIGFFSDVLTGPETSEKKVTAGAGASGSNGGGGAATATATATAPAKKKFTTDDL